MNTRAVATLFAAVLAFGAVVQVFLPLKARAQAPYHHPLHENFYQHWRDPVNPNVSCCNARIETNGVVTGDCEPTHAKIVNGNGMVWIRQIKDYVQVPDNRVMRERNPNSENAHVCWTKDRGVICFVPEDTGG